jgi:hypothetical protein
MYSETEDVIRALAENAEGVCRAYLPAGRREGSYWIVGDLQNNPGRSLFVRLTGPASGPGAAGKFTEHVAARVMLRGFDFPLLCSWLPPGAQHNISAGGGIS